MEERDLAALIIHALTLFSVDKTYVVRAALENQVDWSSNSLPTPPKFSHFIHVYTDI